MLRRRHKLALILVVGPALALGIDAIIGRYIDDTLRPEPPVEIAAKVEPKIIRVIPLVRWPLWCQRIGGIECPVQ